MTNFDLNGVAKVEEPYSIKATLVVNPANMSDFKKLFGESIKKLLSDDGTMSIKSVAYFKTAGTTQNAEIKYKTCITFDELLLLALQYVL